ncbi:MAG: tetratricopeptide repeat protein, partial [Patescibacteria group bacterium]|nr:tetratricopeptide repeat protein [Patescibacteria group bacterium]
MTIPRHFLWSVSVVPGLAILLAMAGCREPAPMLDGKSEVLEGEYSDELLAVALENLGRLEQFRSGEMLETIVERLNQWAATQPPIEWHRDALLDTLPPQLAALPVLEELDSTRLPRHDGAMLQQAVWLRNIARWARGEKVDELSRAMHLFDWVVRNTQPDPLEAGSAESGSPALGRFPWETLLLGHGGVLERAWVYIELLRQEGIDAAMLGLSPREDSGAGGAWAIGVLIGGEIYLFDPVLGLPVPGPNGMVRGEDGRPQIRPATLAEAAADPAILRRLDLDETTPYPVEPEDLDGVVALIVADPSALSRRMKMVESQLVGDQKLVLTVDAAAQGERFAAVPRVTGVRLWAYPYVTIAQQAALGDHPELIRARVMEMAPFHVGHDAPLWKGRVLHFKGRFVGEESATQYYQAARPANSQLDQFAAFFYEAMKAAQPGADDAAIHEAAAQRAAIERPVFARGKQDASYWLGLMAYEQGAYDAALDYLAKRTLDASPDGPWTHGARYNLARTYEATGELDKAVSQLASDPM